ncbi:TetR/AcrR family transcriptional regulator [Actinomyces sp. MRS3W]|uniref:TetR/AcrR family transcriptional regulator n=1 Tax=Actinomyces sp. MRS3W TaxID=2800796 RepID=UPI0028FD24E7|nr:TetR/AcrR family transcriptional regulator [Actinomyces sp. MRS3W]MDU0349666.1 TetR/AcrR family transcriptional regulator [Actinomyces sp. MRS3W]
MAGHSNTSPVSASGSGGARWRGPGRPPAGSENKHERILNEAVALFGAHGYAGTSLADIAAAAEISKAGLLHHFASKEALFAQVLERRDRQDRASLLGDELMDDPWALLDSFVALVEHNTHHRELVAIYTATTPAVLDPHHPAHAWLSRHLETSVAQVEESLERGKAAGTVRAEAPSRLIARSLMALSDGLQIQWLCSTTPGTAAAENVRTGMVDEVRLYVDGLKQQWRIEPAGA